MASRRRNDNLAADKASPAKLKAPEGGAFLVTSEAFDGRAVDLMLTNRALRGLWVPPGEHGVTMRSARGFLRGRGPVGVGIGVGSGDAQG